MSTIKKNFAYNAIYQLLGFVFPLITTPYISRVLGATGIGAYSYSFSVASYFILFAMLGLNNYGNRSIAMVRNNDRVLSKTFCSIYVLQLITSFLCILAYTIYIFIISKPKTINIIMLLYVLSALFDISWFIFGMEKFKIAVLRNLVVRILTVCSIFVFVRSSEDTNVYAFIMVMGTLVSQLMLWPYLKKYIIPTKIEWKDIAQHIKPNLILFIPVIAVSLYKIMDKIMLGSMSTVIEVGYFESVEKVIGIPISLINALGTVMLPRMTNIVTSKNKNIEGYFFNLSILFAVMVSVAMSMGILGISEIFVPLFYGPGYEKCAVLLVILMPSCIFIAFANVIRTQFLIPHSFDKEYVISCVLGAIVNLIINYILIPRYLSVGAAIGTLLAEFVVCLYQAYSIRNKINVTKLALDCSIFVVLGILMAYFVYNIPVYFSRPMITLVTKIAFGVIFYIFGSGVYYIVYLRKKYILRKIEIRN